MIERVKEWRVVRELARMVRMVRRGEIDRDLMAAEMETRRILESVGYEIADWEHFAERDEAGDLYVAWPVCDPHDCDPILVYADDVDVQGVPRHHTEIVPGHVEMMRYLRTLAR